jgi:tetraacyldisaccharide 4'-kinase
VAALPLELAYRVAVAGRGAAYRARALRVRRAPVAVISVGNLSVGGTGKTPIVGWLVRALLASGRRPAVALRGYGRDERLLHERWSPTARVHVDRDRVRGACAAAAAGADVVVLDDGFQHRRLARDLDLVLIAAEQPFPGPLLPRGPYREPPSALRRADWVIVTRRVASAEDARRVAAAVRREAPDVPVALARLAPDRWQSLAGALVEPPRGDVLAVAGVAGPEAFAELVREATGARVDLLDFPDHHEYGPADGERVRRAAAGRPVVVTEKDAVKLGGLAGALPDVRVLTLAVEIEEGEDALRAALRGAAAGSGPAEGDR